MWPEPITQPTLQQFLNEINYFEEPSKLVNIGLTMDEPSSSGRELGRDQSEVQSERDMAEENLSDDQVSSLVGLLGQEAEVPEFDSDDAALDPQQLFNLALNHGIFRDLFDRYVPQTDHINFTPEQAQRLDRLIPDYWITDLPYSRVKRHRPEPRSLYCFRPVMDINVRFVHNDSHPGSQTTHYAHTVYHGNVIPASEALVKPSITLDGHWTLQNPQANLVKPAEFKNWKPGNLTFNNLEDSSNRNFYSILMLNLDYLHPDLPNLHWFITNISVANQKNDGSLMYDELCEYLPVHGIKGFGHSRYVFLVLQHTSKLNVDELKIESPSPNARKFHMKDFIDRHAAINMTPVGVSWFQTSWDESSNKIFHDHLKMKAPVYESILPTLEPSEIDKKAYPGKVPFNVFLDHCRSTKDINKQVLLERLNSVDPFDYRDQYVPPKVPPTVFLDEKVPSWMHNVLFKKKNKIGYWRGLRPASATIPLNNNADLDYPIRPIASSKKTPPGFHNIYQGKPLLKKAKDSPYSRPVNEHQSVFVQTDHKIHVEQARKMMEDLKPKSNGDN